MKIFQLINVFSILTIVPNVVALSDAPLVLLISLDGLNYRFINKNNTPNIWQLGENGVFASKGIKVQFTTVTASNHHCIATGLYQETHGIIDNTFYDPRFNEHYDIWNFTGNTKRYERSRLGQWYMYGEPIWQSNMNVDGRFSGTYHWPMGDAEIPGVKEHKNTTWMENYTNDTLPVWKQGIDKLLDWYTDGNEPINLGLYYHAEPDHVQHSNDLYGQNVTKIIHELDTLIGYLRDQATAKNLFDKLNIILTADHGHAMVKDESYTYSLDPYITKDLVINSSCTYFPRKDKNVTVDDIYRNLTRAVADGLPIRLWRHKEFPEKYHWKNNLRVGPVIVVDELHYQTNSNPHPFPHGTHGYLNDYDEMNAFFVAHGPAFKRGYVIDTDYIQNIDIYPLMCHILGVQPAPNNGSFERISVILDQSTFVDDTFLIWFTIICVVVPCFALIFSVIILCVNGRSRFPSAVNSASKNNYRKLETNANFDCNYESTTTAGNGGVSKMKPNINNPGGSSNGVKAGNKPLLLLEKEGSSDDEL